jgi:NADH-ubiquinone oxidoreductase chain 2
MIFFSILILIVAIALPSINKNISSNLYIRISSIILLYSGLLALNAINIPALGSGIGLYNGLFQVTFISQIMDFFIFFTGSLILIAWPLINNKNYNLLENIKIKLNKINNYAIEYSLIILFSVLGASLLISSADLISMYLSIELQSFGIYILSTIFKDSDTATSAGLKYFLLGGLSSCLILLGAGLIYSYSGLTNFESIYSLIFVSENNSIIQVLNLGFIFIIVGLLFKIAAAPLHNWAPDVYDDSPTIVTIWLTIMPKISILILLLELYSQCFNLNIEFNTFENINFNFGEVKNLLLISSLLSLIIGTIVGLAQTKIKRLLAYSTISHIGFILLALSIANEQSIESLLFYIIQYTITNLNTFLILIAFAYIIYNSTLQKYYNNILKNNYYFTIIYLLLKTIKSNIINYNIILIENIINIIPEFTLKSKNSLFIKLNKEIKKGIIDTDIKYISELKGQFLSNPLISLSLSICLFSMAGIPPLIGFFAKQFVLYSAIQSGYFFISIIAILVSVISASYYLKIIKVLHETNETKNIKNNFNEKVRVYYNSNSLNYIYNFKNKLLELYANTNKNFDLNKIHINYFKEIQLIFILIFIFKFDLIFNNILIKKLNSLNTFNFYDKNIYTNKEIWQLDNLNNKSLIQIYLNETKNKIENNNIINLKKFNLLNNFNLFFKLSNYHTFLISNLTIIILLFVLNPSILLSSMRLLSLSIFTY